MRTTTWGYDELNRLKTEQMPGRTQVTYTYDPNGNLASFTDAAGTVGYDHDAANQLQTVTEPDSDTVTFDYDDAGNRTQVAYPNGVTHHRPPLCHLLTDAQQLWLVGTFVSVQGSGALRIEPTWQPRMRTSCT